MIQHWSFPSLNRLWQEEIICDPHDEFIYQICEIGIIPKRIHNSSIATIHPPMTFSLWESIHGSCFKKSWIHPTKMSWVPYDWILQIPQGRYPPFSINVCGILPNLIPLSHPSHYMAFQLTLESKKTKKAMLVSHHCQTHCLSVTVNPAFSSKEHLYLP